MSKTDLLHVDFLIVGTRISQVWCKRAWRRVVKTDLGRWYCSHCNTEISHRFSPTAKGWDE